ncbi:protein CASC3 isoform X2 [Orussus abietinus]|uniref:protein CASC3 isoform X2 n=1 Tax=Orussus abietinus TaxID=222816 RepID=UPI00062699D7|nr:protein CASC3 isoform X2 [Orussus abietinus]
MSDTRRRRKSHQSGGSDDLSDSYEELNVSKDVQSNEQTEDHPDSEYETGDSDTEAESQEGAPRESGDGQEEDKPPRKLDDDEDRRNPQYIPKRGTFYEHDDRTADEVANTTVEVQNERETKEKKVWKDEEDKWNHDRYNDDEQAPKSHEELIAVYGYDIRNEEGPPRARRRRRYGRGPNKYTRNWEDEDAYGKTPATATSTGKGGNRRINKTGEEFPALISNTEKTPTGAEEPVISSAWYNKSKSQNKAQNISLSQNDNSKPKSNVTANHQHINENKSPNEPTNPAWKKENKSSQNLSSNGNNVGGGDTLSSVDRKNVISNFESQMRTARFRVRGRGFKANVNNNGMTNRTMETKPKGRGAGPISAENKRTGAGQHDDEQQLTNEMKHMNVGEGTTFHQGGRQNKNFYAQSTSQQRPNSIPPRMQQQQSQQQPHQQQQQPPQQQPQPDAAGSRPKRYSSLRRPTIPEGPAQPTYQPQHGQHGYYPPQAGNSRSVLDSQAYPPGHFEQTPPVPAPAAPMAGQPVIPIPPGGQPANYAPPPFLVPPPQFIPPQTAPPSIINYVPGPTGPTFQPNYQGYQGFTPAVQPQGPPPPQELFQPQGCTYYSPSQQQQQASLLRRPKAAIPILPPPDNQNHSSRGRGRSAQQQIVQPGNAQRVEDDKTNAFEGVPQVEDVDQVDCDVRQEVPLEDVAELRDDVVVPSVELEEEKGTVEVLDVEEAVVETPKEGTVVDGDVPTPDDKLPDDVVDVESVASVKADLIVDSGESELTRVENAVLESNVVEEAAA